MRHARRQQMAERDAAHQGSRGKKRLTLFRRAFALGALALLVSGGYAVFGHPDTPLPRQWNPLRPLVVSDPVTPLTAWKLSRTVADEKACNTALSDAAEVRSMDPRRVSDVCYIANRVMLSGVGQARIAPVETSCATALRLAMWERHSVQPAAEAVLGQRVTAINHIGSYSCRPMRTGSGISTRMSTHATAQAIDVTGFSLATGDRLRLLSDWDGRDGPAAFLREVRDGACDWFGLTLSPDFNRLHADHFHLQATGWGGCR